MMQWCIILQIYCNMCRSGGFNGAVTLMYIHGQSTFSIGLTLIIKSGNTLVLVWFLIIENILYGHGWFPFLSPIFTLSRRRRVGRHLCSILNRGVVINGKRYKMQLIPMQFTTVWLMMMSRMTMWTWHMVMSWLMLILREISDAYLDALDYYIRAEIVIPGRDALTVLGNVNKRKRDAFGDPIG